MVGIVRLSKAIGQSEISVLNPTRKLHPELVEGAVFKIKIELKKVILYMVPRDKAQIECSEILLRKTNPEDCRHTPLF